MTIKINAQGSKRKELVQEIGSWLGYHVTYMGPPTFSYKVGSCTVDKDGNLTFDDTFDCEVIERLLQHLYDCGFDIDLSLEANEGDTTAIEIPTDDYTEQAFANLQHLVDAKANLIKKALGTTSLPIVYSENKLVFDWFPATSNSNEMQAYTRFVEALWEMAKKQKRINAKEKEVENENYAFRCFLLRLGFIGDEYKKERKVLLSNLSGSGAFKNVQKMEDKDNV